MTAVSDEPTVAVEGYSVTFPFAYLSIRRMVIGEHSGWVVDAPYPFRDSLPARAFTTSEEARDFATRLGGQLNELERARRESAAAFCKAWKAEGESNA